MYLSCRLIHLPKTLLLWGISLPPVRASDGSRTAIAECWVLSYPTQHPSWKHSFDLYFLTPTVKPCLCARSCVFRRTWRCLLWAQSILSGALTSALNLAKDQGLYRSPGGGRMEPFASWAPRMPRGDAEPHLGQSWRKLWGRPETCPAQLLPALHLYLVYTLVFNVSFVFREKNSLQEVYGFIGSIDAFPHKFFPEL